MAGARQAPLFYRKLDRRDARHYLAHLRRLGDSDRRSRFMGELSRDACRGHVARLDWNRSILVGCFIGPRLRGVAELHPEGASAPDRAEAAFTVERAYQNHGIATALMQRLLTIARNRAFRHVYLLCLVDNQRIRKVARKFGASLSVDYGDATAELQLLPATPFTFMQESLDDGWTWAAKLRAAAADLLLRPPRLAPGAA